MLSILRVMAKHSMFVTTPEEFSIIRVVLVLGLTTPSISTAPPKASSEGCCAPGARWEWRRFGRMWTGSSRRWSTSV